MNTHINTPVLPESVPDATVVTWHKQPGEFVLEAENLVDLETDKVVLEVPAPQSGILQEILQPEGSIVTANTLLGSIKPGEAPVKETTPEKKNSGSQASDNTLPPHASPSVRQQLKAQGLDENDVNPSGRKGHIMKEDIQADTDGTTSGNDATGIKKQQALPGERLEKRVPMTRLRARIAERLQLAQQNAAILTTFNEVDMQAVMQLRKQYKDPFEATHDVKLGFMSFFVLAACTALKKFPEINASIDGTDIVYHGFYDIGVAVSTDRGLVVPAIRNADGLRLADIEKQILDFAQRAQSGHLTLDDLNAGTFTISNGGVFGSLLSTPILNPPQSAILGMHKIEKRAVVVNDEIVIRPMMYLALSYDHRLIDGQQAVEFLAALKNYIEDPAQMLLSL